VTRTLATLAAVATLTVQVVILTDMVRRDEPPYLVGKVLSVFSSEEETRAEDANPDAVPADLLGQIVYGFHRNTMTGWKYWMAVGLAMGIMAFLVSWVREGRQWGFLEADNAITSIGVSVLVFASLMAIKGMWLLGRGFLDLVF